MIAKKGQVTIIVTHSVYEFVVPVVGLVEVDENNHDRIHGGTGWYWGLTKP